MSDTQNVLTEQAIFDAVCEHMDKQRAPSMEGGDIEACAYRGENGLRCAVGCLLSDAEFQAMGTPEGESAEDLSGRPEFPMRLKPFVSLLSYLQSAHDDCSHAYLDDSGRYMGAWRASMRHVAAFHDLSTARLDAIEV